MAELVKREVRLTAWGALFGRLLSLYVTIFAAAWCNVALLIGENQTSSVYH